MTATGSPGWQRQQSFTSAPSPPIVRLKCNNHSPTVTEEAGLEVRMLRRLSNARWHLLWFNYLGFIYNKSWSISQFSVDEPYFKDWLSLCFIFLYIYIFSFAFFYSISLRLFCFFISTSIHVHVEPKNNFILMHMSCFSWGLIFPLKFLSKKSSQSAELAFGHLPCSQSQPRSLISRIWISRLLLSLLTSVWCPLQPSRDMTTQKCSASRLSLATIG